MSEEVECANCRSSVPRTWTKASNNGGRICLDQDGCNERHREWTIATLRQRLNDANKALAEEIRRTNDARAEADALRGSLRSVLDSADEAVRWMTHVGTVTIDRVGNFEGECECLRSGPDTCDCGSDTIRFAYRRVAKDARQLLKGRHGS